MIMSWLLERQPPNNFMHLFTLLFQSTGIGGVGLATFSFVRRERESRERFLDDQVNFSLAQCQAFYRENNIHEMLHHIEVYKWNLEKNDWRRGVEFTYMPPFLRPRRCLHWADTWLADRNSGLDAEASAVETDRAKLTCFFYMVKQCWEQNPQRRDRLTDFLFQAPLNQGIAMKHLILVEALDRARCKSHPECTWEQHKPPVYDFLRSLYSLSTDDVRPPEQSARPASAPAPAWGASSPWVPAELQRPAPASAPSWGASSQWAPAELQASWRMRARAAHFAERVSAVARWPSPDAPPCGSPPRAGAGAGLDAPPPPPASAGAGPDAPSSPRKRRPGRARSITGHEMDPLTSWTSEAPPSRATSSEDVQSSLRRSITKEEVGICS